MDAKGLFEEYEPSMIRMVPTEVSELTDALAKKEGDKTLIIGSGGVGCHMVKRVYKRYSTNADLRFFVINSDYSELSCILEKGMESLALKRAVSSVPEEDSQAPKDLSMFNGQGAGGNPEVGESMMKENMASFLEIYERLEQKLGNGNKFCRVLLMFGFGGGTGSGSSLAIAKALHEKYKYLEIYAIAVTPMMSGSEKRMQEIVQTVEGMEKYVGVFVPIDQEGMYRAYGDMQQTDANEKLYDVALQFVNAHQLMASVPVEKNIDASDAAANMCVSPEDESQRGQCVVAGYVEAKIDAIPEVKGLDPNASVLTKLLYSAVPGPFMYLRDVQGAKYCTIKVAYGANVSPTMNDFSELEDTVRRVVGGASNDFTSQIGYGFSPLVEKDTYRFAVLFSQFKNENDMKLSARLKADYEEWREDMERRQQENQKSEVLGFNTYRAKREPKVDKVQAKGKNSELNKIEQLEEVNKIQKGVEESSKGFSEAPISSVAQSVRVPILPIIEEQSSSAQKPRRRVAASTMETLAGSREIGKPIQTQLDFSSSVERKDDEASKLVQQISAALKIWEEQHDAKE